MEIRKFENLNLLDIGNDYIITGMMYTSQKKGNSIVFVLPQETVDNNRVCIIYPTKTEWDSLLRQADLCEVEGIRDDQRVILRKGQRNIDTKIMTKVHIRDGHKCRYCAIDFVPLTVDHIITWETGGATHEDNLLTSCKRCNKTRGNMNYKDWLQSEYYLNKMKYLDTKTIQKNYEISLKLDTLPRVSIIRNR